MGPALNRMVDRMPYFANEFADIHHATATGHMCCCLGPKGVPRGDRV